MEKEGSHKRTPPSEQAEKATGCAKDASEKKSNNSKGSLVDDGNTSEDPVVLQVDNGLVTNADATSTSTTASPGEERANVEALQKRIAELEAENELLRKEKQTSNKKRPAHTATQDTRIKKAPKKESAHEKAWHAMYQRLKDYHAKHKNCLVPDKWKEDTKLANWVGKQRQRYKNDKLTPDKVQLLTDLNFTFQLQVHLPRRGSTEDMMERLAAFQKQHGHVDVPQRYAPDKALVNFVREVRKKHQANKLEPQHVEALQKLGFQFRVRDTWPFEEMVQKLAAYQQQHGDTLVPQRYPANPALGRWVQNMRIAYHKGSLSQTKTAQLDALNMCWRTQSRPPSLDFDDMMGRLLVYKANKGHVNVPARYPDDTQLAIWCLTQRKKYRLNKLSNEHQQALEKVGFQWSIHPKTVKSKSTTKKVDDDEEEQQWNDMYAKLQAFQQRNKHANPKIKGCGKDTAKNRDLGEWVQEQRDMYEAGSLSADRSAKLEALGFDWQPPQEVVDHELWMERYEQLKQFQSEYGHCRVPKVWKGNTSLAQWAQYQRERYYRNDLSPQNIQWMESLGFVWRVSWDETYERLKDFAAHNEGSTRPTQAQDEALCQWACEQRLKGQDGAKGDPLKPEQMDKLKAIHFDFTIVTPEVVPTFDERLESLRLYRDTEGNGSCHVPQPYPKDPTLATWVNSMRSNYKKGKVPQDQITQLEAIGFDWTVPQKNKRSTPDDTTPGETDQETNSPEQEDVLPPAKKAKV